MVLSTPLADHLACAAMFHSRLCPRQVLGVRMARMACDLLGVDPALERKSLSVYMEIGRCAADGVIVVTLASPTNGLMRLMDYGKIAATFVRRSTGEAIRISERPLCRQAAVELLPHLSPWEAQRDGYQSLPDAQLFNWQPVQVGVPPLAMPKKQAVICQRCGDRVNEQAEVVIDGAPLCKACAYTAYFSPITISPAAEGLLRPDLPVYSS